MTTLEKEMNNLMDRVRGLPIHVNDKVHVCWDKSHKPYKYYTIHRGPPLTIYLTSDPIRRCRALRSGRLPRTLNV